jgi:DNA polymerase-3 subunit gamma/tau
MSLYQKIRPDSFETVVGNKSTVASLKAVMAKGPDKMPHNLLFMGPSGCGKTTLARIVAAMVKCLNSDLQEINAAQNRGIDMVRGIQNNLNLSPMHGETRVYIIDECHQLTAEAQDSLLKMMEDTPKHVFFLLCTTDSGKLKPTLRNRCTPFTVTPLSEERMIKFLRRVCTKESFNVPDKVLSQIAMDSMGSSRAALVLLELVSDLPQEEMLRAAKQNAAKQNEAIALARLLFTKPQWPAVAELLRGLTTEDPEGLRRMVLSYCTSVMLSGKSQAQAWIVMDAFSAPFYYVPRAQLVKACYEATQG